MANTALVPVNFHGTTLHAVTIDGKPFVSIRSVCDALTVDWPSQLKRIKRHPALASTVVITATVAEDGKQREVVCLPLDMLNGWLFGISAARVRDPARRARLVDYQRECFDVLARHFGVAPQVQQQQADRAARTALAFKLATQLAAEVQRHAFDAVMNERHDEWARFVFCLQWDTVAQSYTGAHAKQLDNNALLVSLDHLVATAMQPGSHLAMASNQRLAGLAAACTHLLNRRMALAAPNKVQP